MKRVLYAAAALGVALALSLLVGVELLRSWAQAPLVVQEHEVEIPVGSSVESAVLRVARALGGPEFAWRILFWLEPVPRVSAGRYRFEAGSTPQAVLAKLARGEVELERITIIEGWTFRQMLAALRAHPQLRQTIASDDEVAILAAIGAEVRYAEGWFFPDTYLFAPKSSEVLILREAHERMRQELAKAWQARAPHVRLPGPEALLILASIVEKETAHPEDRGLVASVFLNRLERGMPLQADPTVIYAGGNPRLSRRDLQRDAPHNTYTRTGLPPTPIALPSRASLWAVAQAPQSEFLYFVATGVDGRSYFSKTLAEHNEAVRRYRAAVALKSDASD